MQKAIHGCVLGDGIVQTQTVCLAFLYYTPSSLELAVTHMHADWLHHPWHLGGSQRFKAGDKISNGPHEGRLATSPLAV